MMSTKKLRITFKIFYNIDHQNAKLRYNTDKNAQNYPKTTI